jgi:hypothetical protein
VSFCFDVMTAARQFVDVAGGVLRVVSIAAPRGPAAMHDARQHSRNPAARHFPPRESDVRSARGPAGLATRAAGACSPSGHRTCAAATGLWARVRRRRRWSVLRSSSRRACAAKPLALALQVAGRAPPVQLVFARRLLSTFAARAHCRRSTISLAHAPHLRRARSRATALAAARTLCDHLAPHLWRCVCPDPHSSSSWLKGGRSEPEAPNCCGVLATHWINALSQE